MKRIFLLLLLFTYSSISFSQKASIEKGDEYFTTFMYDLAKDHYEKALYSLKSGVNFAKVNYKLGFCYKMLGDFDKAEIYFKVAVDKYVKGEINEDVLLFYADALRMNGKYEDAIDQYNAYLKFSPNDARAKSGMQSCVLAPQWINKPTRYRVVNASKFNSSGADFSPVWAGKDCKTLYFTSSREGTNGKRENFKSGQRFTDIFESVADKRSNWSTPTVLQGGVNTDDDEGASTVSQKGNEMFFTRCKAGKNIDEPCKIFYSQKKGSSWGDAYEVNFPGFKVSEVGYPALSQDDNILYFSAESSDGYGEMDLYMAKRKGKSGYSFSDPINLGSIVNTPGNEVFPTVRDNGDIYFASDGHEGMGGLDIYKIIKNDKGQISAVENLKYPINSSFDDFSIIFYKNKEEGFFSSNRKGGKGSDDLYSFSLQEASVKVSGLILDTTDLHKVFPIADASISVTNQKGEVEKLISAKNGTFIFDASQNSEYKISVGVNKDYLLKSESLSVGAVENDTVLNISINLAKTPKIIVLPNIEYELGKADLKPASTESLDKLVETLKENPNLAIELRAHTDFRASDEFNLELSNRRAQSCVDYLVKKGINVKRLVAKGYGESHPRVITDELAIAHPAFKSGDILSETYINKLKNNELKEEAHQLNRRTEFGILSTEYHEENIKEDVKGSTETEKNKTKKVENKTNVYHDDGGDF